MKENKNWIKIDGKGKTYQYIIDAYTDAISAGYNLTMQEIADYLRCTYNYVQRSIAPNLSYLVVNDAARTTLYRAVRSSLLDHNPLYAKRRLYLRSDFEQYVLDNAQLISKCHRFSLNELSEKAQQVLWDHSLKAISENPKLTPQKLFYLYALESPYYKKHSKTRNDKLKRVPQVLYSMQDIQEQFGFSFRVQAYRHLASIGAPKVKIGSLVRYQDIDLDKHVDFTLPNESNKERLLKWIEQQLSS